MATEVSTARPFKRRSTRPIPADAKIGRSRGKIVARWRGASGKAQSAPIVVPARGKHRGQERVLVESVNYYGEHQDGDGVTRRLCLGRDYDAAAVELDRLIRLATRERRGLTPRAERRAAGPIRPHLDEYRECLRSKGVSDKHLSETMRRIESVVTDCGFTRLADIRSETVVRFLNELTEKRSNQCPKGRSPRCVNTYRGALRSFVRWAIADKRMDFDPLATVPVRNEANDIRIRRRALTPGEAVKVLDSATRRPVEQARFFLKVNDGGEWRDATDSDRRMIGLQNALRYKTMILCGLRKGELDGLTWAELDADRQAVYVSPQRDKAGREGWIAIRADLLADLYRWRELRGNPPDDAPIFTMPVNLARVLKKDLKHAGIEFETHAGRVDVHALRTTCATWLAGVALPAVYRQHMRHGGQTVTERHYVKLGLRDTHAAVAQLPALPIPGLRGSASPAQRATGTDDAVYKPEYKSVGEKGRETAVFGPRGVQAPTQATGSGAASGSTKQGFSSGSTPENPSRPQGDSNPCRRLEKPVS